VIISLDSKAAVDSRPFDQVLMTPTEPSHEPTMTGAYDKDISINTYQHHHKLIIRVPVIVGQFHRALSWMVHCQPKLGACFSRCQSAGKVGNLEISKISRKNGSLAGCHNPTLRLYCGHHNVPWLFLPVAVKVTSKMGQSWWISSAVWLRVMASHIVTYWLSNVLIWDVLRDLKRLSRLSDFRFFRWRVSQSFSRLSFRKLRGEKCIETYRNVQKEALEIPLPISNDLNPVPHFWR